MSRMSRLASINQRDSIGTQYFQWLKDLVCVEENSYNLLLKTLHQIGFYYVLENDSNRLLDGKGMKLIFSEEEDIPLIYLLNNPNGCSVLEMLIALARRWENEVMYDPQIPNRTAEWFWGFINNLGLGDFTDDNFHDQATTHIEFIVNRFMDRDYKRSGEGGICPLKKFNKDQRKVEIWYQMHAYFSENY